MTLVYEMLRYYVLRAGFILNYEVWRKFIFEFSNSAYIKLVESYALFNTIFINSIYKRIVKKPS